MKPIENDQRLTDKECLGLAIKSPHFHEIVNSLSLCQSVHDPVGMKFLLLLIQIRIGQREVITRTLGFEAFCPFSNSRKSLSQFFEQIKKPGSSVFKLVLGGLIS